MVVELRDESGGGDGREGGGRRRGGDGRGVGRGRLVGCGGGRRLAGRRALRVLEPAGDGRAVVGRIDAMRGVELVGLAGRSLSRQGRRHAREIREAPLERPDIAGQHTDAVGDGGDRDDGAARGLAGSVGRDRRENAGGRRTRRSRGPVAQPPGLAAPGGGGQDTRGDTSPDDGRRSRDDRARERRNGLLRGHDGRGRRRKQAGDLASEAVEVAPGQARDAADVE